MKIELYNHLCSRIPRKEDWLRIVTYSWISDNSDEVYFPLWNLSGQLVGYQKYDHTKGKCFNGNNPKLNRYYTYCPKERIGVWGLEYIKDMNSLDKIYITEGIFDAISIMCCGHPAIAMLSNNPQKAKSWLRTLNLEVIGVCDGDSAGKQLTRVCDKVIVLPDGEDANSLPLGKLKQILEEIL